MATLTKFIGNAFYFGIIPKIPTFINVFLLPIITPFLSLEDYGIWGIITSYSSLFVCLAPLGLHVHLHNYYFEVKKWKIYWGHLFFLMLFSGLIFSVIYICVILIELQFLPFHIRFLIGIFSCTPIYLFATSTISSHLYPLLGKPLPLVTRNLISGLSTIVVTFVVIVVFKGGYWGWILGSFTGSVVAFSLFFIKLKKEGIYPIRESNFSRIKKWMKISYPAIPHALGMMFLTSSARIIMSLYGISIDDIGIYTNGYSIGDYVTIVSVSLVTALMPSIQKSYRENRFEDYRNLFFLCQAIALVVVFLTSIWMPLIYDILIKNKTLHIAIPVASLICFANVLNPLYNFLSIPVYINKKTLNLLWLMFVPGILNVVLCSILIPKGGYMAAVYCTLISYWSQLLIPFISRFHNREIKKWLGNKLILVFMLFLLILSAIVSSLLEDLPIENKIIISCLILIGLFIFWQRIRNKFDRALS